MRICLTLCVEGLLPRSAVVEENQDIAPCLLLPHVLCMPARSGSLFLSLCVLTVSSYKKEEKNYLETSK